jgi:hypothetical protein
LLSARAKLEEDDMNKGLGLVLVLAAALGGCVVHGEARVRPVAVVEVDSAPPPPEPVYEQEVTIVQPGMIWIGGRYNWEGGRWVWARGHYERERAGYMWAPGRWDMRGGHRVWVEGEWRAGGAARVEPAHGPVVRDHREHHEPAPAPGPVVRDHR